MNYVGKWVFHSIGAMSEDDEMVYMNAEEYLASPMLYIDETDEEAVAEEMKDRKQVIGGRLDVCEDGTLYMLVPIPEGVSQEEVDAAAAAGQIMLRDGMLTDEPKKWEERDGELWLEVGFGMSDDGWVKMSEEGELLQFMTTRYVKAE